MCKSVRNAHFLSCFNCYVQTVRDGYTCNFTCSSFVTSCDLRFYSRKSRENVGVKIGGLLLLTRTLLSGRGPESSHSLVAASARLLYLSLFIVDCIAYIINLKLIH